ncbi:acetyl-coenzyme A synthetase, partial [Enterobacter hormaechei]|nr:acetyl-coenzyme A synthetase [Enterobacter hormaechei]
MTKIMKHPIPIAIAEHALMNEQQYQQDYQLSLQDPDRFWGEKGKIVDWIKPYTKVKNTSFDPGHINIRWFEDGTLNLSANCLDRHLKERGEQTAIIWEGDDPTESKAITYREL